MNKLTRWRCWLALCLAFATPLAAQDKPQAFVGAQLIPIVGGPITNGTLVIHRGKITALGPRAQVAIPADAEMQDVAGQVLMPGLVCTHSHIGSPAGGDRSSPIQPEVRVLDSIDIWDTSIPKARAGGITTINLMPGSGHLISGQTLYLKLRDGRAVDDFLIKDADGRAMGGLKMANGTNSRRDPPFPGTRAKSAALVREKFIQAMEYRDKVAKAGGDAEKLPARDLGLEVLVEVLNKQRVVHHHTHRHDDILTVLRLQQEFGFRVVLHHVSEAWKVAEELAAAQAPCSIIMLDSPGGKIEARDIDWKNAPVLEKAGVPVGFHTDDPITDSRLFLRSAAFAVRAGMSRQAALEGLTLAGAKMLDLESRIGSLEPGKDADFILLSGDPLSVYSKVLETYVEGRRVFDRAHPKDKLMAEGGYGASSPQDRALCCYGKD